MRSMPSTILILHQSWFPLVGIVVREFTPRAILACSPSWIRISLPLLMASICSSVVLAVTSVSSGRAALAQLIPIGIPAKIPAILAQYAAAVTAPAASFMPLSSSSIIPISLLPAVFQGLTSFTGRYRARWALTHFTSLAISSSVTSLGPAR